MKFHTLLSIIFAACLLTSCKWGNSTSDIVSGNGRVEGDQYVIETLSAGQIVKVDVTEGAKVQKDQVLVEMDAKSIQDELDAAQAQLKAAQKNEQVVKSQTNKLSSDTAEAKRLQAAAEVAAALSKTNILETNLANANIKSPINGQVIYKLVQPGEVLPAGGRVAILVDPDDLYMSIYISEKAVGKIKIGDEARIKVDALSQKVFLAHVSYISEDAQFTPKEVQTSEEREKLVFKIKLHIDTNKEGYLKLGMPGEGYVKTDPSAPWPRNL